MEHNINSDQVYMSCQNSNDDEIQKYSARKLVIVATVMITFLISVGFAVLIYLYTSEKLFLSLSYQDGNNIVKCRLTLEGPEYRGRLSVTGKGNTCLKWSAIPEASGFSWMEDQENYCRNPIARRMSEPFCYVEDPESSNGFDFQCCYIPMCPIKELLQSCKETTKGENYLGNINITMSGRVCQNWADLYPHNHTYTNMSENGNFCRNPNGEAYPWCFTMDVNVRWEECLIRHCDSIRNIEDCLDVKSDGTFKYKGRYYEGFVNTTISGKTCMQWVDAARLGRKEGHVCDTENYCRNTFQDRSQPWCYTTDPDVEWEICDIPACE